jgi:hypothetical protein
LNRRASGAELNFWERILNTGSRTRTEVAFYPLSSVESFQAAVNGYYREYLNRAPTDSERNAQVARILRQPSVTPAQIVSPVLGSQEYFRLVTVLCPLPAVPPVSQPPVTPPIL